MTKPSVLFLAVVAMPLPPARAADDSEKIPEAFAPFEDLVGAWKGTGIPAANRLKGWKERHLWAWKFAKGRPVAMTLATEGSKVLAKAELTHDPASGRYRLDGADARGKPARFEGAWDPSARALTLERPAPDGGRERLTLRPNSNKIRYVLALDRREPDAPQFGRVIEMNLGKEGESFAAGGAGEDLPKCIVTGGAATMSVSYEGKTYPLCCTGCRDEFNENPARYIQKALLRAQKAGDRKPAASSSKGDGSFDGLLDDDGPRSKAKAPSAPRPAAEAPPAPAPRKAAAPKPKATNRAASLLAQARALERGGQVKGALSYYRDLVKEYPGSPEAKAAASRIRALEGR